MPNPQLLSEKELIQKCKNGNLNMLEKLYKHFYGYALGIGMRYMTNKDDALEVVNDSFIKLFNTLKSYNEEMEFKPWFRKIIVNTAIDRNRKERSRYMETDIETAGDVAVSEQMVSSLNVKDILNLLEELPHLHRTVFNLYEIDGYSHNEIGQMLNIPEGSSRKYLSRAKEQLRTRILSLER